MKKYVFGMLLVIVLLLVRCGSNIIVTEVASSYYKNRSREPAQWLNDRHLVLMTETSIVLWDRISGDIRRSFGSVSPGERFVLSTSESARLASFDGVRLRVWNISESEPFFEWAVPTTAPCALDSLSEYSFSADGTWFLLGCRFGETSNSFLFNLHEQLMVEYPQQQWYIIDPYASQTLDVDPMTNEVYSMDIRTRERIWTTTIPQAERVFLENITEVSIVVCDDQRCFLLDRRTGELQQSFVTSKRIFDVAVLETTVVTIGTNSSSFHTVVIETWDTRTGKQLRQTVVEQVRNSYGYHVATDVSRDGSIALAFSQHTDFVDPAEPLRWSPVYLYDSTTLEQLASIDVPSTGAAHVSFDPTGTYLFTGSRDDTFKIWEIGK